MEKIENSLWHLVLVTRFLFLSSAIFVVVQDAGKDSLANSIDVILGLLVIDLQRDLECILDRSSLSQKQVEIRHFGVEVLDDVFLILMSNWNLVQETFHQATNDHAIVLRHFALII